MLPETSYRPTTLSSECGCSIRTIGVPGPGHLLGSRLLEVLGEFGTSRHKLTPTVHDNVDKSVYSFDSESLAVTDVVPVRRV